MNILIFEFLATQCRGWPWIRIKINDAIYLEKQLTQQHTKIPLDLSLPAGKHVLYIERFNKTDQNTIVDDLGNILQDQTVTLNNIWYDNVDLPMDYLWQGEFCYDSRSQKSVLNWGPNGHWIWMFETPILQWLVNIKNNSRRQAFEILIPTPDTVERLKTRIKQLQDESLNI